VRTTLTLDDDVHAILRAEMRKSGRSFKETANSLIRAGVEAPRGKRRKKYKVRVFPMGERPGLNFDKTSELIERLEGSFHR